MSILGRAYVDFDVAVSILRQIYFVAAGGSSHKKSLTRRIVRILAESCDLDSHLVLYRGLGTIAVLQYDSHRIRAGRGVRVAAKDFSAATGLGDLAILDRGIVTPINGSRVRIGHAGVGEIG